MPMRKKTAGASATSETNTTPAAKRRGRPPKNAAPTAAPAKRGRKPSAAKTKRSAKTTKTTARGKNLLFALDIGTRSVIGIVAH